VEVRPSAPDALPLPETRVLWVGGDVGFNAGLDRGRVGGSAAFFGNLGQIAGEGGVPVGIQGGLFDAEVRGRWAPGAGSVVRAEAILATGDGPGRDYYTGVLTGNSWGIVGAVATTHGCSLLFPDARAINRQVAAVYDVSNGGAGLGALTASAGWDPIPNRLTLVAGGGLARAADGSSRGTELNARVLYRPWPLGELGLHGARLLGTAMPSDPWMVFTSLDGLVF
jgi:hypothetical protein